MENLLLQAGDMIVFSNVTLPKATFVQLQPHLTKFTELPNPRVVLERALRNFTCLTKGDRIVISFKGIKYELDVREVKPGNAVSIIETDVNVDFFEPRDFKDIEAKRLAEQARLAEVKAKAEQEALKLAQASPALSGASPAGASSKSDYFARLGSGNKLVTRKKAASSTPTTSSLGGLANPPPCNLGEEKVTVHTGSTRTTGGAINAVPPSSSCFLGSSSGGSSSSSGGSGGSSSSSSSCSNAASSSSSSAVRMGNSGASRLLSGSSGSSASSSDGSTTTTAAASKFTYVYKDDGKQKKTPAS